MKTILVPVRFTDDSTNAAHFAIQLAVALDYEKVVLFNTYETPIPQNTDPMGLASGPFTVYDVQEFKAISESGLAHLKTIIQTDNANIKIETISEYGGMTATDVDEICKKINADLIVIGISDEGFLDDSTSDAIAIAKSTTVPTIAVPINCTFKPILNVVLACDLKKVAETVPVGAIQNILDATNAKLMVLHIQEADEIDYAEEEVLLHQKFDSYNPEYHLVKNKDFAAAIHDFVVEKSIDLVITIPKKHGWFEGLFKTSHVKTLAFHSHVPLLMVHE